MMNYLKNLSASHPFLTATFLVGVTAILLQIVSYTGFISGDDIKFLLLCSGKWDAETTYFMSNSFFSICNALYREFPGFEWYTFLLVALQFAAHSTIGGLLLSKPKSGIHFFNFLMFLSCFTVTAFHSIQWTVVAGALGVAGTLLSMDAKRGSIAVFGGVTLAILGCMIRPEAVLICSVLAACPIVTSSETVKQATRKCFKLAALFGFSFAFLVLDAALFPHQTQLKKDFQNYNRPTAALINRTDSLERISSRPQILSENDARMMAEWFYDDAEVFGLDQVLTLSQHASHIPPNATKSLHHFVSMLRLNATLASQLLLFFLTLVIAMTAHCSRLPALSTGLAYCAAICFLYGFMMAKVHVVGPMLLGGFASLAIVSDAFDIKPKRQFLTRVGLILLSGLIGLLWLYGIAKVEHTRRATTPRAELETEHLRNFQSQNDKIHFCFWRTTFAVQLNPWRVSANVSPFRNIGSTWLIGQPINQQYKQSHFDNSSNSTIKELLENEHFVLVTGKHREQTKRYTKLLKTYCQEHFARDVDWTITDSFETLLFIQPERQ